MIARKRENEESENLAGDFLLRPADWSEYVGQENVKKNLNVILAAAKSRGETPDHLLFYGQAGLGKTSLAHLVAKEIGTNLKVTSGPALEKMGDLAAVLSSLEEKEILFIDEAHRINKAIEEVLYPAMETRKLYLVIGKGPSARTLTLDLPPFTLIAATTKVSLLSGPLRSRFGATFHLDYYSVEDIKRVIERSAGILGAEIEPEAVEVLARASRFTPRVANRLLKRSRDFVQVAGQKTITRRAAEETLELLEIDELGLEAADRRLLETIIGKFNGGPVGVGALAAALNEERATVEDVYEPFLMATGLIRRTPAGRTAEDSAYRHLKIVPRSRLL